jgi:hypothetical protein
MKQRLETALDELDQAFESLEITPLSAEDLGRIAGGLTEGPCGDTSSGYTCNSKCGPTQWWECGPTAQEYTCAYVPPYCTGDTGCFGCP